MGEIFSQEQGPDAPFEAADTRIARLHFYYVARELARGADVIDLFGGDGSGPALLAQVARQVSSVQDDADADLVLAFGLLARQPDPAAAIGRLARLVRPGGRLMMDVPARPTLNPDIRHAFSPSDLIDLLGAHFPNVRLFRQRGLIGSVMLGDAPTPPRVFTHRGPLQVEVTRGIADPDRLLCIAGDAPLDDCTDSLLANADLAALAHADARAVQAEFELHTLHAQHAALAAETDTNRRTDAQWRHQLAVLRVDAAAAETRATTLAGERDELVRTSIGLIDQAARAAAECARLQVLLDLVPPPRLSTRLRQRLRHALPGSSGRIAALRASALFDPAWYRATYADVAASGIDPARHYLRHGGAENRDPGPDFDAPWYTAQHRDLAGLTPLEHFERHGRSANWPTRPDPAETAPSPRNPQILFVAGETGTPGAQYRCARYAEAARAAGWTAEWRAVEHTGAVDLIGVRIAVLWRVQYSAHVAGIMREIHAAGGTVVFDVDDLMIRPELATTRVIDGIRTTNAGIGSTREFFANVQQAMIHADLCTTTTLELAQHMRAWQKATYILPNGFDAATLTRSRRAVRARAEARNTDGLIRIGYAAGTMTHQKDFAVALPGLLNVLEAREKVRLVLFRAKGGPELVVVDEFDALAAYADRIEWRDKVDLETLPDEIARFDINIAPLELGNPFCEAKSELKYFEAALVDVPTIASPTGPFARAMIDGQTGLLAADDEAWHQLLLRLIDDAELRRAIGRRAYLDCLWQFGPQRRVELFGSFLQQIAGTPAGARSFALDVLRQHDRDARGAPAITLPHTEILHLTDRMADADVTVVVPCYNYAEFVIEALESVRTQTLAALDLIIVDDCSTDPLTVELVVQWARTHDARFNRLLVLRHAHNEGLSAARNTGFAAAETPYVLPLDADNRLRPACAATLADVLTATQAAYAYGSIQMFGASDSIFCNERYQPMRLVGGNYIDAMALVAKWAWAATGGYAMPHGMGWEDYDLWCRFAEIGQRGIHVDQILSDYRVHDASMVANVVETIDNKQAMVSLLEQRHPWLHLSSRTVRERV